MRTPRLLHFPIIERELRLASRRGLTYWMRLVAALATLAVSGPLLLFFEIMPRLGGGGIPFGQLGPLLFGMVAFMAIATSVASGWFFASDAIAQERREGTLELLFLAPVSARDVVLSKLATLLWRSLQWLLAMIPLFALPVLTGGVRGRDFVALALVALSTLFWSITTSLYASSKAGHVFQALVGSIVLQLAFLTVPFLIDLTLDYFQPGDFLTRAGLLNPIFGWTHITSSSSPGFWLHLALLHASCWVAVGLTIHTTGRQIRQDPSVRPPSLFTALRSRWTYGSPSSRAAFRRRLLAIHPIRWLVERERSPARFLLVSIVLVFLGVAAAWFVSSEFLITLTFSSAALGLFSILLALVFAAQATRFLVEARRSGALELILVSAVSSREILRGQFQSLRRTFALPIAVVLLGQGLIGWAQSQHLSATLGALANPGNPGGAILQMYQLQWLNSFLYLAVGALSYVSLAWTGAWMGFTCRQSSLALFASLGIAKILPLFVSSFAQASLMPLVASNRLPGWMPIVLQNAAALAFHLGLIFVARYQLLPDLRRLLDAPTRFLLPSWAPKPPPVLPKP